ncbi:MAG: heme exporter protein CcmB [Bacteroidetes bacterium]|nr:heme exporter protein CcmB [Bacteroidota bacterium]MCL5737347.1 heme exporter protein CcmB [Bacteroidota bacterium]
MRGAAAVFSKDLYSELRTRYALNSLIMFVVVTLSIILFSTAGESVSPSLAAGILWIIIFFAAMSGLSRSFVSEEERGTTMTLQLWVKPSSVLLGKLAFNAVLIYVLNILIISAYLLTMQSFRVQTPFIFFVTILLGSFGLASASTFIAAIISKANSKGTLYPVLSFPILLPLLMSVIDATRLSVDGASVFEAFDDFKIMLSYAVVVTTAAIVLFDFVWRD